MSDTYYQSAHTGQQIDDAISRIVGGELDKLVANATNAADSAKDALNGVQDAIENIPSGSTPIVNDFTTGGTKMALSAEMGKLLGQRPNPNLLDNWYFVDPVNQRGQTEYTAKGYTIDRWHALNDMSVSLGKQGLTLEMAFGQQFTQFLEDYSAFDGSTMTASILFSDNTLASGTIVYDDSATDWIPGTRVFFSAKNIQFIFTHDHGFLLFSAGEVNATIKAIKLELGSVQTLAHQDASGNWVLNDPPPNKQQELAKCQRYQIVLDGTNVSVVGVGVGASSELCRILIPTPVEMRATPSVSIQDGNFSINGEAGIVGGNTVSLVSANSTGVNLYVPCVVGDGKPYIVQLVGGKLIFDANL